MFTLYHNECYARYISNFALISWISWLSAPRIKYITGDTEGYMMLPQFVNDILSRGRTESIYDHSLGRVLKNKLPLHRQRPSDRQNLLIREIVNCNGNKWNIRPVSAVFKISNVFLSFYRENWDGMIVSLDFSSQP